MSCRTIPRNTSGGVRLEPQEIRHSAALRLIVATMPERVEQRDVDLVRLLRSEDTEHVTARQTHRNTELTGALASTVWLKRDLVREVVAVV